MTKMPAGEFKTHCLQVMEQVRTKRESVLITKRGVPVAKLVPVDEIAADIFGCLKDQFEITGDIVGPVLSTDTWDALR